jgi:hypothetical protein
MNAVQPVSTERVVGSGRSPERILVVAAILLAVLVVKPWEQPLPVPGPSLHESSHQDGLDGPVAQASPIPTVSPGPNDIACEGGWRLVSITHLATWTIKDWTPVDPSPGPGPVGQNIPFVALDGDVRAVGVCGDGQELGNPDRNVSIGGVWRVIDAKGRVTATSVPLATIAVAARPAAFARMYRPQGSGGTPWSPGRYVLQLDVPGATWWLGIVVSGTSGQT